MTNVGPDVLFMSESVDQLSEAGRKIIQSIEAYKLRINQVLRVVKYNPQLTTLLTQKLKNLDQAANAIYQLVFSIENLDIVNVQNQALEPNETSPNSVQESPYVGPSIPQGGAPAPPPSNLPNPLVDSRRQKDENSAMPDQVVR